MPTTAAGAKLKLVFLTSWLLKGQGIDYIEYTSSLRERKHVFHFETSVQI